MSGYPDPNYAGAPDYSVTSGTDPSNAKPGQYWQSGNFTGDVTIGGNLSVGGETYLNSLTVDGVLFSPTYFKNPEDGRYYQVLAFGPYPADFVPPK